MQSQSITYKLWIHTLPEDLQEPLAPEYAYLKPTAKLYKELVDSAFVYPVYMIDEFGQHWVSLDVYNGSVIEEHTLKIDEETFDTIECSAYEIILEK